MKSPYKLDWLYGIVVVLILWTLGYFFADTNAVPSPWATLSNCLVLFQTQSVLIHIAFSLMRLLIAVALASFIGIALGLLMGLHPKVDRYLAPVLYVLFPIPKVAFLPVLFVFLGLGEASKITLILLILVFQITLMIRDTLKAIPTAIFLSAQSMDLKGYKLLRHVLLPSVSKTTVSALRISIGTGIAVLFFAENYATDYGLGFLIMNSWSLINYLDMYSGIVYLSLMGAGLFALLDYWEKRFCRWHY